MPSSPAPTSTPRHGGPVAAPAAPAPRRVPVRGLARPDPVPDSSPAASAAPSGDQRHGGVFLDVARAVVPSPSSPSPPSSTGGHAEAVPVAAGRCPSSPSIAPAVPVVLPVVRHGDGGSSSSSGGGGGGGGAKGKTKRMIQCIPFPCTNRTGAGRAADRQLRAEEGGERARRRVVPFLSCMMSRKVYSRSRSRATGLRRRCHLVCILARVYTRRRE